MESFANGKGGGGRRQPAYRDAVIQGYLTLQVLFELPLRQTAGFVKSLLKLVNLDWNSPDFSTLCRRQKTLSVAIPYCGSAGQLHLLVDSTEIRAEGEGEWNARKQPFQAMGGPKCRLWRKIPIDINEETLEIRVIGVTSGSIGPSRGLPANCGLWSCRVTDALMLPDLLDQIAPDQEIGSVTADGANDTRKFHDAIAGRNALHRARMPSLGNLIRLGQEPETRPCGPQNFLVAPCGTD